MYWDSKDREGETDIMTIAEESLALHYEKKGKIEVVSTVPVKDAKDLSLAYRSGRAHV